MLRQLLRLTVCFVLISSGVFQSLLVDANQARARAGSQSIADPRRVPLYDGMVSFVPPPEFSQLSAEIVALKFPEAKGPGIVYGNTRTTVSIAITFPPQRALRPEQLPAFKTFMESLLEKQKKGLEWVKKELVVVNGQQWIHFEFISQAVDTKIHNHIYVTSLDERMLVFNFNATVEEYDAYKDALDRSKESIQIKVKQ